MESEEEQQARGCREQAVPLERSPSGGVIRKHSTSNGTHIPSSTAPQLPDSHGDPNPNPAPASQVAKVTKVKEEPADSEEEEMSLKQVHSHQPEVKGRLVIQAMI